MLSRTYALYSTNPFASPRLRTVTGKARSSLPGTFLASLSPFYDWRRQNAFSFEALTTNFLPPNLFSFPFRADLIFFLFQEPPDRHASMGVLFLSTTRLGSSTRPTFSFFTLVWLLITPSRFSGRSQRFPPYGRLIPNAACQTFSLQRPIVH